MDKGYFKREGGNIGHIVVSIPRIARAMENLSTEQIWPALKAVEGSYKRTSREAGLEDAVHVVSGAIMRRLKGQLAGDDLTEMEIMRQLRDDLRRLDVVDC